MKYSASNKPLVCMQTQSTCYKGSKKMTVKGVLWHSTGANNPNLKRYVQPSDTKPAEDTYTKSKWLTILGKNGNNNDMNHIDRKMGMNAWIGKLADGTVATIQTLPEDYRPWGCASGKNGSCNDGWIQFEICEDGLNDKAYFEKIYKEACEYTAYMCKKFNLDPKGTVTKGSQKVPVILCHQDSYKLGLGSNHSDIYHWFKKYGKDMDDVRNDVAALMKTTTTSKIEPAKTETPNTTTTSKIESVAEPKVEAKYVVRKTWVDTKSQIGAYAGLDNAKKARDKAGNEYEVYDIKTGALVYPAASGSDSFKVGDVVKIIKGATWSTGSKVPAWLLSKNIYVREIRANGLIVVSTLKTGALTGALKPQYLTLVSSTSTTTSTTTKTESFKNYLIIVTANSLNVRANPSTTGKITTTIKKGQVFTIVDERNGWGKLKSGAGWVKLDGYTKKI